MNQQNNLFLDKRFMPLFITQFCGCLNDSILKSALIIMVMYKISSDSADKWVLFINAIFILPFILFASISGQIADKYEKSFLIKIIKFSEIFIVLLGIYGFIQSNLTVLFLAITLMGVHSAFFGTLKFSIIPDHLEKDEFLKSSGYIEFGTFIGILMGTLLGGMYNFTPSLICFLMIFVALAGFVSSLFIPKSSNYNTKLQINYNFFQESISIFKNAYSKQTIFLSILGISWFWFVGAGVLSQIPSLTKNVFGADESVANLFLSVFSIGVGVGSFWCNKLLNDEVNTKYVFNAAVGMAILGIALFLLSNNFVDPSELASLTNITQFLYRFDSWLILIIFFFFAVLGGLYIVPLYGVIQMFTSPNYRSRMIAANNLLNAIFMCISSIFIWLLIHLGCSVPFIILIISLLNFIVAGYIYTFLPEVNIFPNSVVRWLFRVFFDTFYKVEIQGLDNFYKAGKKVVIISNHISYLDAALLAIYIPDQPIFAINRLVAKAWWIRPLLQIVKTYPVDTNNPMAIKNLIKELKQNKKIIIFPEGRISSTGKLMKMYSGPAMVADKSRAVILPVRISGPEYTIFSSIRNLPIKRSICKVKITILPAVDVAKDLIDVDHKFRLRKMSERLYEIMCESMANTTDNDQTIFSLVLKAAKIYGFNYPILEDADDNVLTYRQIIAKSFVLGDHLVKKNKINSYVGLMMPNVAATCVVFLAMHTKGLVPTMINFTSGAGTIIAACKTVQLNTIYTSRKFVEKAGLEALIQELSKEFEVCFLEDVAGQISTISKIKGLINSFRPEIVYNNVLKSLMKEKIAVILFTSGTENSPKAVALSNKNIVFNISQIMSRLDFSHNDKIFNALPMFHCFGLGATITSLVEGIKLFLYPSPLHYKIIPEAIYNHASTIMFSTDTFLNGYAKFAHSYDFHTIRYIFAGAEKLKHRTKEMWSEKFGVSILEGYGTTETSPVISFQTRLEYKPDTVGKILPFIEYKLIPVEGIVGAGRLAVKGDNVMLGYISSDNPGQIKAPEVDGLGVGWYDTGDIVSVDEQGYIKILGRAKRFAKIAGEMVSLGLLEDIASSTDPLSMCAAVSIDDEKKGEQIILFTTSKTITKELILSEIQRAKVSELLVPKSLVYLAEIPVLATGKVNYRQLLQIALEPVENKDN